MGNKETLQVPKILQERGQKIGWVCGIEMNSFLSLIFKDTEMCIYTGKGDLNGTEHLSTSIEFLPSLPIPK